ncbi:hypothetical protein OH768_47145 [Streptomyces sp. NBC_01622]|uniref:hypothetical protein n=1 Tax=Streptomyces sp. NBC_01622 TaxID=2975903 RepID=UPI003865732C|nr:hypothetical protein OH768_47145 [Streptomyces sp. NBC_01622]
MVVRRHRIFIAISAALISAPAMLGLVACGPDDAVGCARAADALSESVGTLGVAVKDAVLYPKNADKSIERIRKNLDDIRAQHHDKDVLKAIDDMEKALDNVKESVDNGDKTPDLSPAISATGEITKACTR